ncbi:glutathionylspermidine synthase family protein [Brevibacillus fluminis]|uniref:glutathionylspermidine synthase family protein n=1 Tax=Brevibacillus fluminis TaxID=511487 RepID=UPI003F8C53A3
MREEGIFTWDEMYGEEYALAAIHLITDSFREELTAATAALARIFAKTVPVVQQADERLLLELGVPEAAVEAVRLAIMPECPTVIGRFDFAQTPQGLKMLECNSDTPTGIVEAFYVNGQVCSRFQVTNPNAGMERHIRQAFARIVQRYRELGYPTERIWFSALDWHEEDAGTTRYLLQQSGLPASFVPLADLRVTDEGVYAAVGEELCPIDLLYRLHALEKLAFETDEEGFPSGAQLLALTAGRKVGIINPPSAFVAQTKALQALMWGLHEAGEFFDAAEQETIRTYMLPTYFTNEFHGRCAYVTKPIFGREGGGVTLYRADGQELERDQESEYWDQPMIYQEMAQLPAIQVETLGGSFAGHLLWGSFFIGGEPSALVARVGGRITNNMSYFLPVGVKGKKNEKEWGT